MTTFDPELCNINNLTSPTAEVGLKEIGLGEFCLELHSHKARKLEVLGQLRSAGEASADSIEDRWNLDTLRLTDLREKLNEYVATIHGPYPNGLTPFQAIGIVVDRTEVSLVDLSWPSPRAHDLATLTRLRDVVTRIGLHGSTARSLETTSLTKIKRLEWAPGGIIVSFCAPMRQAF
ncbi:MAG: hypothetical protein AB9866_25475 [Syntrophobacteraceae bacterium]